MASYHQGRAYVVVENAGMIGEVDRARFATQGAAWSYISRTYSDAERDRFSPFCLYPDVCLEEDGSRTYDI